VQPNTLDSPVSQTTLDNEDENATITVGAEWEDGSSLIGSIGELRGTAALKLIE